MIRRLFPVFGAMILAGCSHAEQMPVPPSRDIPNGAIEAKEAIGRQFFQATDTGTIYVYDPATLQVLFAQPIMRNERFVLDPAHDVATIEGKAVYAKPINSSHIYRLYFLPGGPTTAPATQP